MDKKQLLQIVGWTLALGALMLAFSILSSRATRQITEKVRQ